MRAPLGQARLARRGNAGTVVATLAVALIASADTLLRTGAAGFTISPKLRVTSRRL